MFPAQHHRYRLPVPAHPTVLPASISDLSRASVFFMSSVPDLSALCVELFSVAVATLPTLCFHQLTNCFFRNSRVFKNFCVALCFFQIPAQKENQDDPASL
jgi:hypothetical protein